MGRIASERSATREQLALAEAVSLRRLRTYSALRKSPVEQASVGAGASDITATP